MNLTIADILSVANLNSKFIGDESELNIPFKKVTIDSRKVNPGDLFIAIRGDRFDGHQFVHDVLSKGVKAAVVSRQWYAHNESNEHLIVVDDTLRALQDISNHYRKKFSIPFISITGSNGKTTTKEMISHVLSQKYEVMKNPGNLNNHIGVPLTLFMLDDTYDISIIEMGTNHFGEIRRLAEISEPGFGLITNIGPAHLEFFGSLEGVERAKTELWDYIQLHEGTAFVNLDDPFLASSLPGYRNVITYGFNEKADISAVFKGIDSRGCAEFYFDNTKFTLNVPGEHNVYNALATIAVSSRFGVNTSDMKRALEQFKATSKRMEIIQYENLLILNDCYNSNMASAEKALQTLANIQGTGKKIAILADMLELGELSESHHREIGHIAATLNIDHLLAYGPLSLWTIEEAKKRGLKASTHFEEKSELIKRLNEIIHRGDTILIKGSRGMAMEEVTDSLLKREKSS